MILAKVEMKPAMFLNPSIELEILSEDRDCCVIRYYSPYEVQAGVAFIIDYLLQRLLKGKYSSASHSLNNVRMETHFKVRELKKLIAALKKPIKLFETCERHEEEEK